MEIERIHFWIEEIHFHDKYNLAWFWSWLGPYAPILDLCGWELPVALKDERVEMRSAAIRALGHLGEGLMN